MKKNILITGGTGLIGSRLRSHFGEHSHFYILTRSNKEDTDSITYVQWDIKAKTIQSDKLPKHIDAVINLVGAGIADEAWSAQRKQIIIDSRAKSTKFLFEALAEHTVDTYIGASAIGYYGDRDEETLTPEAKPGNDGFLSHSCQIWEEAHHPFQKRVNSFKIIRIGIVLSNQGGALAKLILPARLGGAGYFGNGSNYYAWIHIDDLCRQIVFLTQTTTDQTIFNGTVPNPVTFKALMRAVKNAYAKYAIVLGIPQFLITIAMGERSTMLLNSTKAIPSNVIKAGFSFVYTDVDTALEHLNKNRSV